MRYLSIDVGSKNMVSEFPMFPNVGKSYGFTCVFCVFCIIRKSWIKFVRAIRRLSGGEEGGAPQSEAPAVQPQGRGEL